VVLEAPVVAVVAVAVVAVPAVLEKQHGGHLMILGYLPMVVEEVAAAVRSGLEMAGVLVGGLRIDPYPLARHLPHQAHHLQQLEEITLVALVALVVLVHLLLIVV
jgi:hypothetical protein